MRVWMGVGVCVSLCFLGWGKDGWACVYVFACGGVVDGLTRSTSNPITCTTITTITTTNNEQVAFNYLYRYRDGGGHFPFAEGYHTELKKWA